MTDTSGKSKEEVALELLRFVAIADNIQLKERGAAHAPTKEWVLNTYTECLIAVANPSIRYNKLPG